MTPTPDAISMHQTHDCTCDASAGGGGVRAFLRELSAWLAERQYRLGWNHAVQHVGPTCRRARAGDCMNPEAKRSIKHGGWLPYLEKLGIDKSTASNWMALAGHVESQIPNKSDVRNLSSPTLADAGIDKRPRRAQVQP